MGFGGFADTSTVGQQWVDTGHPDKEIGAMVELLMGGNGGILGTAEPLQQTTWGMECNS
eukprot:CAMPEP_0201986112 /NCGR_PEP_ID=MMETSP0904-20121228/89400_1 /ASSEMBLY_ACC=CAM_ASM_000553 /TAXON_ID=420261 /ORGANISM="Thalassiosira antarctica, Strain CCMP982" /LENGTH=58 /DNA_ID=CAMNT_0048539983 /DNA_START=308 /DNA_END=484 /DNA_ORIENTATION=+